jgi:hypothetical protein
MSEKSGIQMIEEILGHISILDKRMSVIEHLLKQLLSIANTGNDCQIQKQNVSQIQSVTEPMITASPNARVIGSVIRYKHGIHSVNITIRDSKNNVVKRTKTNRSGEWMALLPPDEYTVECYLKDSVNGIMKVLVKSGDKIVRVALPEPQDIQNNIKNKKEENE